MSSHSTCIADARESLAQVRELAAIIIKQRDELDKRDKLREALEKLIANAQGETVIGPDELQAVLDEFA